MTDIFPSRLLTPNFGTLFLHLSYLIDDIGTKNGFLHVFLIQLDDTFDIVDNLLDIRR